MPAYVVAQVEIRDEEAYAAYLEQSIGMLDGFPARVLVSDDDPEIREGDWPGPRTVVVEFPSAAEARAWYESDGYQRLAEDRQAATITNLVIAEGVPAGS